MLASPTLLHCEYILDVAYSLPQIIYSITVMNNYGKGNGIVSNLKLVEIVILGAAALLAAFRFFVKFLDYAGKLSVGYAARAA